MKEQTASAAKYRKDLTICEAHKMKDGNYKVALSFHKREGNPTPNQIKWLFDNHLQELNPVLASATLLDNSVVVVASVNSEIKPLEAKKDMVEVVASLSFLDQKLGQFWNVKEIEGSKVLQQVVDIDVSDLVNERRKRMGEHVTASTSITASVYNLSSGDTVKVHHDNKSKIGKVKSFNGKNIVFDGPDGVEEFDKDYVLKIIKPAVDKVKETKESREEFFTKLYGSKKFAKQLVE